MSKAPARAVVGAEQEPLLAPDHLSYSSKDTLDRCAKAYFLSRIAGAPARPALWLAGGSAVHETTEAYDRGEVTLDAAVKGLWNAKFDAQLAALDAKESDRTKWRSSKAEPVEVWRTIGLDFVQTWIDWRKASPFQLWTAPDGTPGIELDVSGHLPGCDREIKGYIDRVFWDPAIKQLMIVDIKTGTRKPESSAQFGVYSALFEAKYGLPVFWGAPFMNRKGPKLENPYDLSIYTPQYVGLTFGRAETQIDAGLFNPRQGSHCFNLCDVADSCYAADGRLSEQYDPDHPRYLPGF
jgi:putative RecB family exonuclease